MKNPIVSITTDTLTLSSSLSAEAFGKVNPVRLLDERGWVATVPNDAADTDGVTFAEWRFDGTQTDTNGVALFAGTSLGNGKTLRTVFADGNVDEIVRAAVAVCSALTAAIAQNVAMEAVGAEGIVVFAGNEAAHGDDAHNKTTRVLFLPAAIFERCANNAPDGAADFYGFYVRKGLEGKESLLFTRAVIAYRALCGALPYPEPDVSLRQTDIFDARFVPLYLMRAAIDETLCTAIDCGLQVSASPRVAPGERRYVSEKETEKRKRILSAAERFSVRDFAKFVEESPATTQAAGRATDDSAQDAENSLAEQRAAFVKKQNATVRRKRFLRRNHNRILVTALAVVLGVWAVTSFERENRGLATSKGLTSWETTQALYATIHQANVPHLQEIAKGKNVKTLRQIISGFYVTTRSRSAMNQDEGTVSPAEWLFLKNKTQFWQYGITHLQIDGTVADSSFSYPTRADKPTRLAAEPGVTLKNGATAQHTATYFLVNNDGSARINVNKATDTVTLTWKRGRWLVTNVQSKSKSSFVFTKDFYATYQAALDATDDDVVQAAAILRETYAWIPTDEEIRAGEKTLQQSVFYKRF